MKSIRHKLLALSVSCALVVSLAGCGVNVTGVALNLPDSIRVRPSPPHRSILLMVQHPKALPSLRSWTRWI